MKEINDDALSLDELEKVTGGVDIRPNIMRICSPCGHFNNVNVNVNSYKCSTCGKLFKIDG